jgi:DNA-binding NtrC family response regulator
MQIRILLADDDASLRRVIQYKLEQEGYEVNAVSDGEKALKEIRARQYDLVLSDIKMPNLTGVQLLEQVKKIQPTLEVILITAFADVSEAVRAVKLGAFDYLTKPFDDEQLLLAIEKALKYKKLENENKVLKEKLQGQNYLNKIVGVSKSFKNIMNLVDKIAPSDATVLLTGASGTGKEVIARAIHYKSPRRDHNFIAVNCAAIPKELIESELFGHVRGAFTGAVKDKKGKFELADGGTLLLDEVSELNLELQAKLLRVIQELVIEPVGSEKKIEIDIRLIAATNVDLKERIAGGKFREDLFYRLNVIPVRLPNLRDRKEDIPILMREFIRKIEPESKIDIDPKLLDALEEYSWPGNIRELENLVERMVVLRKSDILTTSDLPQDFVLDKQDSDAISEDGKNKELTFHGAEKKLIIDALEKYAGNKSKAARHLKIPRHVLIYRIKKYEIKI